VELMGWPGVLEDLKEEEVFAASPRPFSDE
jgi:hypothetical protein